MNGGLTAPSRRPQHAGRKVPRMAARPSAAASKTETDMTLPRIEWIHLDCAAPDALSIGDVVSAAAGGLPTYRVVAIEEKTAWVRDETHADVRALPIDRLHWKISASVSDDGGAWANQAFA